jgi:hypothetical protein
MPSSGSFDIGKSSHHEDAKNTKVAQDKRKRLMPFFSNGTLKLIKQSNPDSRQSHIRQNLRLMYFLQLLNALQFDDKLAIDQQINPITAIEPHAFVAHR